MKHHTLLHRKPSGSTNTNKPSNRKISTKSVGTSTERNSGPSEVSNYNTTVFNSSDVYLNVIPVRVSAGNKSVLTYAFLNQGSTATLCDKRLLNQLEVLGEKVDFNISTIKGNSTRRRATKVNFTLSSLIGPDTLVLPEVLSVDNLPTNPNPRLSQSDLKAWPHVRNLELPQIDGAVTALIGVDVPEAFWIEEERRGGSKNRYAVRSKLGWAIIGKRYLNDSETKVDVNFVNTAADQLLERQIECLWTVDNVPLPKRSVPLSKEDRYALQVMKGSKNFVDGHYEIALPWRPESPQLQDNRTQALSRLTSLKKRLEKDHNFKDKYVSVVESYIVNGHAELVDSSELDSRGWYLSHHPVLNPGKPNKVRVVFDCAAGLGGPLSMNSC